MENKFISLGHLQTILNKIKEKIDSIKSDDGYTTLGIVSTLPEASSAYRGKIIVLAESLNDEKLTIKDSAYICLRTSDNTDTAYVWHKLT